MKKELEKIQCNMQSALLYAKSLSVDGKVWVASCVVQGTVGLDFVTANASMSSSDQIDNVGMKE